MHIILAVAATSSGSGSSDFYTSGDVLWVPVAIIILLILSSVFGKNKNARA